MTSAWYSTECHRLWRGREDPEENGDTRRWHQVMQPYSEKSVPGHALLGLSCDAGVARNQGRAGARQGPGALRGQLANLAYHLDAPLFDAGDIVCEGDALEDAQALFAQRVASLLGQGHRVIGLGGGHEIAFASFSGLLRQRLQSSALPRLGILNLDAHLDLRQAARPSSGTPFRQCAERCAEHQVGFHYTCLGVSRSGNTRALFDRAHQLGVDWVMDEDCLDECTGAVQEAVDRLLAKVDAVYLTVCLDALPAYVAPGVSAPSAQGISLRLVEDVIDYVRARVELPVCDVAELNPELDIDQRTARVGARIVERLSR